MKANYQKGFTLLEAIVSIVLLSSVGIACYSLVNTNLISLSRVQDHTYSDTLTLNALEILKQVNPSLTPTGQKQMGKLTLEWRSTLIESIKDGSGYPSGTGYYQVGLYQTHAQLKDDNKTILSLDIKLMGTEQVRFWVSPI